MKGPRVPTDRFRLGSRTLPLPLEGDRILLRLPGTPDRKALVELLNDPVVSRGTLRIPYPYQARDALQYIRTARIHLREGTDIPMVIERRTDGELLGGLGLHHISEVDRNAELGYWIGRPFRRQGFATEAVALGCDAGFRGLGLHRIEASVFPFNKASQGVLRKSGFQREGIARELHWKGGRWHTDLRFSRLATDPVPPGPAGSPRTGPGSRRTR